ncbi:hypothetical protein ACFL3D_07100 [Candidatus Omnitrophota bacterium]
MNKTIIKILAVILIIVIGGYFVYDRILPIGIRHLLHLAIGAPNLFKPILKVNYDFSEVGEVKKYELKPFYSDVYEVGIMAEDKCLPSGWEKGEGYAFTGRLKVDLFHKDKLIYSREITQSRGGVIYDGDMNYFKKVSLIDFDVPFAGKYKHNLTMKVTTLQKDTYLCNNKEAVYLYVGVIGKK